jgi:hypothetical protein
MTAGRSLMTAETSNNAECRVSDKLFADHAKICGSRGGEFLTCAKHILGQAPGVVNTRFTARLGFQYP